MCHEVRNPLSSAIAALSFVSCTVNDPNECRIANEQVQSTLSTDLRVMNSSLQFINELLRNMLDIHSSATKQIEIALKPTDICRDILEPVASILLLRGASIEVQVDCPKDLMVVIRLNQPGVVTEYQCPILYMQMTMELFRF